MDVRVGPWRNWVPKNWCFELWCWRRLSIVPWTTRSTQSILKEISSQFSLEGLILKLKLQYFGHLMGRSDSLEKTLMLGNIEGRRRRGPQRMKWLDGITDSTHVHEFEQALRFLCCSPWDCKESGTTESWMTDWPIVTMLLSNVQNLS